MKKGKRRIAIFMLAILLAINIESLQADAAAARSDFVVIVDERAATTASVKLQNGPVEYADPQYTLTEPEAENIEWGPFYGAFAAVIAIGAGTISILLSRSRKRDRKVIGKRGL